MRIKDKNLARDVDKRRLDAIKMLEEMGEIEAADRLRKTHEQQIKLREKMK